MSGTHIYSTKGAVIKDFVKPDDIILDVGFWGHATKISDLLWPHRILLKCAKEVYGVDRDYDETKLDHPDHYKKQNAESFSFDVKFDVIFAGDVIEHLSNPGAFLEVALRHLKPNGRLIITTPNCFSLFNFAEKILKKEPSVNSDHTFYFNFVVLKRLLEKNGWEVIEENYLDDVWPKYKQSLKRKFLYLIYKFVSLFTPKYIENMIVVAKKQTT